MIRVISNYIEDQFEKIQVDTIYRVFRIAIWILSIVYVISIANSLYDEQVKIRNSIILVLIAVTSIGILMWIKRQVSKPRQQLKWFYIVVLAYTFLVAFTSPSKYMTTIGIALAFFTLLVYLLFSYKMLIIHGAITGLLFLIYSVSGVGKTVTLGLGYVFSVLGAYGLMVITLLIGVKMYHQIKAIYDQQLLDLNGKNDELNALNEEYYATDELLRFNMEHDALTGIMNWQGFVNQVNHMLRQGHDHDFYVVYLDLDDFMHINNAFGYAFGDEVLKQLVKGLQGKSDTIEHLSRGEGDSVLFTYNRSKDIHHIMKLLGEAFGQIHFQGSAIKVKGSLGIAEAKEDLTALDLIRQAEVTMYQVKRSKKGSYAFHDSIHTKAMDQEFRIFNEIEYGIEHNEFYLLYQPKVNIQTREIFGFEALVRWQSSKLGRIFPDQFIGVAEGTGQILPLGQWIMEEAMGFAKKASKLNPNIVVSINISSVQLMEEGFMDSLREVLHKTGVSCSNIAVEVTESAYIEKMHRVNKVLEAINHLGIVIYLDDFGTGYSSLNYLNQLPIQYIKIDKSFIDPIHTQDQRKNLTYTIIQMANTLGLDCIAEGVEVEAQLDKLKAYGCAYVQGYLFDKPLSEADALHKIHTVYEAHVTP